MIAGIIRGCRMFIFKLLGVDYSEIKRLNDITSLEKDPYTVLGEETYHNGAYVTRSSDASLNVGRYCSIAKNVWFVVDDNNHQLLEISNAPLVNKYGSRKDILSLVERTSARWRGINIGNDVWIGMNAIIMPNINVGKGAVIGAGATVTKDVPAYGVVVGNPGRLVKYRYDKDTIRKLYSISWWNWDIPYIEKNFMDFYLPIEDFIDKYYKG